jgi:3-oxoacyl-[acyl-carrier-protein] synthase-3
VQQSLKLKKIMGYEAHRVAEAGVSISDLCIHGLDFLFQNEMLKKQDIDAIVLITQSPDHFMPPTSNIIQGHFQLKQDMVCMDINQGCAGFILGLFQSFMLLERESINKVVLLNADTLTHKVSNRDRNLSPQIGDAASVTVIENSEKPDTIYGNIKMDGRNANALKIPAGGYKLPSSQETAKMEQDANGNFRSLDHMVMKGDEIFNFVQREVPPMIEDLLNTSGLSKELIDYFMFHQPNKFMLDKLADKMKIPREKMPSNIVERFGNSSSVTIPTVISHNLGKRLEKENYRVCSAAFGVGLTWASLIIRMGEMDFCKMIEF